VSEHILYPEIIMDKASIVVNDGCRGCGSLVVSNTIIDIVNVDVGYT